MIEWIRYGKKIVMRAILFPLRALSIRKNRLVLIDNLSKRYSGNPKYIAEYLCAFYQGRYEIFFAVADPERCQSLNRGVKFIKYNSFGFFYCCMTASVIVTNSGGFSYLPLRKKQKVVNTWHGGGAYKKAGIDMYNDNFAFRQDLLLSSKATSVFLSTNKKFSECISKSMLIEKSKFMEIGMPRNDILLNESKKKADFVRKAIGLEDGERLVLYAPTYRKVNDNYFKDSVAVKSEISYEQVCNALGERFGGKWRFGVRLHPSVVNRESIIVDGAFDLTDYVDMQELLLVADAMINDFSSSLWDYMLTQKPCFMYAQDMEHYVRTTKVYTPLSEWPFPKATSNIELIERILHFDEKDYKLKCIKHYSDLGGCETGEATKIVCEWISQATSTE